MNLKNQTEDAWLSKSDTELKELINKGVREVEKRSRTATSIPELGLVNDIKDMQGLTSKGNISWKASGLSHEQLVYRARKINKYLEVDRTSKEAFKELNAMSEKAKNTFNERNDTNLDDAQYREMVELIGAFKDQTKGMDSTQIQTYFEEASRKNLSSNALEKIFAEAETKSFTSESKRMEYIFDAIDEYVNK